MPPLPDSFSNPITESIRLLLVEDSEHDRRFFRRIIEKSKEAYEVHECHDAESALARLEKENFDLLVMDLNLPGIDGIELVRRAQDFLDDTGVLILTGSQNISFAADAVRLRVLDFILKEPHEALRDNLLRHLRAAMKQIQLVRENRRLDHGLRRRLTHLEQIYNQMPDALFATIDLAGRIVDINPQAHEMLGLPPSTHLLYQPIGKILADWSPELSESVQGLLAQNRPIRNQYVEAPTLGNDGRLFVVSIDPVKENAENPSNGDALRVLSLRDITPDKPQTDRDTGRFAFQDIIGRDPAIFEMCELIRRAAPMPVSVLVTGPTGSGKELVAKAIHAESDRAKSPFIAVNCTALSSEILESELFGHVRGAFTGAINARKGRFREADGGTLFLDEIGDTTESFQSKLLRALDSGQIEPVGQDRPVHVDVRIVCATNKDLQQLVRERRFREDLFFRINVVHIKVPPLADRPGDLPLLVERFRQEFNQRFKKSIRIVSNEVIRAIARYPWPGNIRELRHALERAFVVAQGPILSLHDLSAEIVKASGMTLLSAGPSAPVATLETTDSTTSNSIVNENFSEAERIKSTLARMRGNLGQAANELGVYRTTLWRKMRQLGIDN